MMRTGLIFGCVVLVGCAAPGTPGRGAGTDYTPVVDLNGVDSSRYSADLNNCRTLVRQAEMKPEDMAVAAILGAAIGAALTPRGYGIRGDMASYGGTVALGNSLSANLGNTKAMMINCMAGRGYRPLEAAPPVVIMAQPQMAQQMAQPAPPPAMPAPTLLPSEMPPAAQALPPQPTSVQLARSGAAVGPDSRTIQRLPEVLQCHPEPVALLVGSPLASLSSYSVACRDGTTLLARCEYGNCRVLK